MAQKLIRKTYQAETKAAEGQDRTLIVTISTSTPDRSKDVVVPSGMIADNYLRNPVVAAFHRYDQPAIAKTLELQQTDDGVIAKLQFPDPGIYPLADQLYELYKTGFMNAWSIGFIPKEAVDLDPDRPFSGGHRFEKWELLEYSAVLVPDNPDALTMLRSKGIDETLVTVEEEQTREVEVEVDTKQLESLALPEKEAKEAAPVELIAVTIGKELDEIAFTLSDGKTLQCAISPELKELLLPAEEKSTTSPTHQDHQTVLTLEEALRAADKIIGLALRNAKRQKSGI